MGGGRSAAFDAEFFKTPKAKELLEEHKKATGECGDHPESLLRARHT